jgi:hypothetical protein
MVLQKENYQQKINSVIKSDWQPLLDLIPKIENTENFDLDSIDTPAKCKLIMAIVRNDRFHEGALVSAFESGLIMKILKSIERQIE